MSSHSISARLARALRWLAARRLFMPLTARVICAAAVRESPAFFVREVTRPSGMRCYHLRESGVQVELRHSAGDAATLAEVFHRHDYEPIQDVADAIGEPGSILDLGANIGLFGAFAVSRWPQARIVGYEADPANVAVHDRTIAANELGDRWSVICAAAGAQDGEVELAAGRAMGSFVLEPGSTVGVPTIQVPMRDVLAEVCGADLVKLDIEGGEWEILLDPRFAVRPPGAVVLEYHPHLCPGTDPRATAEQALVRAKLSIASIWHRDDGYGMLWGWRTDPPA